MVKITEIDGVVNKNELKDDLVFIVIEEKYVVCLNVKFLFGKKLNVAKWSSSINYKAYCYKNFKSIKYFYFFVTQ